MEQESARKLVQGYVLVLLFASIFALWSTMLLGIGVMAFIGNPIVLLFIALPAMVFYYMTFLMWRVENYGVVMALLTIFSLLAGFLGYFLAIVMNSFGVGVVFILLLIGVLLFGFSKEVRSLFTSKVTKVDNGQ